MAIRNEAAVYIDGINRTGKTVVPLKGGDFLDERLDEGVLSLRGVKLPPLPPCTPVEIVRKNTLYFGHTDVDTQTDTTQYIVADDTAEEVTPGTGLYNHELSLIEVTKALELYIVDTLTYTNAIGRTFTDAATPVVPVETQG